MNWVKTVSNKFYNHSVPHGSYLRPFSMIGMGIGCFAMIISLSVLNGFENLVINKLRSFGGDITISGELNIDELLGLQSVKSVYPFMERNVVIFKEDEHRIVTLKSVEKNNIHFSYGWKLKGSVPNEGEIIIGEDLAYRLGVDIGHDIYIFSPIDQSPGLSFSPRKKFKVSGIFTTNILNYDEKFAFILMNDGTNLFKRKTEYDGYNITFINNPDLEHIKFQFKNSFGSASFVQTWDEKNKSLVEAMKMERYGTIMVLSLIFVVAGFNLAANLSLISIQKMREFGVLRMLGVSKKSIYKIVISLGLMTAGRGLFYGFSAALSLIFLQRKFLFIKLPSEIFFIDSLPMIINITDLLLITLISFTIIFIATLGSAKKIASVNLKKSLEWTK